MSIYGPDKEVWLLGFKDMLESLRDLTFTVSEIYGYRGIWNSYEIISLSVD